MFELKHGMVIDVCPVRKFGRSSKLRLFETSTGISGVFEIAELWFDVPVVIGSIFCIVGFDAVLVVDDNRDLQVMTEGEYKAMESLCVGGKSI